MKESHIPATIIVSDFGQVACKAHYAAPPIIAYMGWQGFRPVTDQIEPVSSAYYTIAGVCVHQKKNFFIVC